MAVAIAWLPGPAGTRRRGAKPSVEEPDAAEPARPDLWGARVSNDPGLPDREPSPGRPTNIVNTRLRSPGGVCRDAPAVAPCRPRITVYATGHIAVPSPPHIPLACRAHQSECGRTAAARGRRKGGPASMDPHETGSTATPEAPRATAPPTRTFGPQGPTLGDLSDAYLQDYQVRQFRSVSTARGRTAHLAAFFGRAARAAALTTYQIRQYQLARRAAGAATGTINRETSALHRMGTLAVHWGWLDTVPGFPDRLRENPPRQGFFEHPEYLAVRAHLPAQWQDILDLAYYSGWRKNEILGLTWDEIDMAGGVIRLSPARSKTLVGRILPISPPIADALARRRARRDPDSPLVFHRDGIPVRRWRTAWRTACQAAGVPTRFLHDCRRTAARNLIRANVPERVAMLLTGHKSRAIFDRYNIIHEQELLDAGDQLVAYLAQQAQAVPARRRPHAASTAAPRPASPLHLVRRTTA